MNRFIMHQSLQTDLFTVSNRLDSAKAGNPRLTFMTVRSFEQQFRPDEPSRDRLKEVWQRLLRDKTLRVSTTSHPKGFVMAVLYMLHIERDNQNRRPQDEHGRIGLVSEQR